MGGGQTRRLSSVSFDRRTRILTPPIRVKWDYHLTEGDELLGASVFLGEYIGGIQLTFNVFDIDLPMLTCVPDGHVADIHVAHAPVCPSFTPVDGALIVVVD